MNNEDWNTNEDIEYYAQFDQEEEECCDAHKEDNEDYNKIRG